MQSKTVKNKAFIIKVLKDHKASDIVSLSIKKLTDIADYMIICTATSNRHVKALNDNLLLEAKKIGIKKLGEESDNNTEWGLADFGDIIVHIMTEKKRQLYALEKMWGIKITKDNRGHKKSK